MTVIPPVPPSAHGATFEGLGPLAARVEARLAAWDAAGTGTRIWGRDWSVWSPVEVPELADRLGWLELPAATDDTIAGIERTAEQAVAAGPFDHVVLLGMGGSSLAPELLQSAFGHAPGRPELVVLDSTHPETVRRVRSALAPERSLFVVSSKSGTTVETQSGFAYCWNELVSAGIAPGPRFLAITDPGTPLERLARDRGFGAVITAPPDVGGRYSALSAFGLVPAALIGVPIRRLLERARAMATSCGPQVAAAANPGLRLGALLGEAALAGRDKLVIVASPALAALPAWLEQLIAESTGKIGRGIVPVVDEPFDPATAASEDRIVVTLTLEDEAGGLPEAWGSTGPGSSLPLVRIVLAATTDLGAELFRWELAVAAASAVLGVQPFDQPDVQIAKDLARRAMADLSAGTSGTTVEETRLSDDGAEDRLHAWSATARPGDYVAIQAFLDARSEPVAAGLSAVRRSLQRRTGLSTTLGYGPRFLHSTGQLHKGGPDTALCLQLVDTPVNDLPVPGAGYTFGQLVRAQAIGDLDALRQRQRRVSRVNLGPDAAAGLDQLARVWS